MAGIEFEITFHPNGTADFQDIKNQRVEDTAKRLIAGLGQVSVRGHKHTHKAEAGVKIHGHSH